MRPGGGGVESQRDLPRFASVRTRMGRHFEKYEGLGNDFVVLTASDENAVTSDWARAVCDRRRGVGGDGVLLVLPPRDPSCAARMKVINADGSVPEMCGNGLRCVALYVARTRGLRRAELTFDTDAGPRACTIDDPSGDPTKEALVTVDMGLVHVGDARALLVGGETVNAIVADAGNPHAIVFGEATRGRAEAIGPGIETHASFPRGTNVECARVDRAGADPAVDLWVWERGVGITLACGTGACATVAAGCARGLLPRGAPVRVRLPGGELEVTIDGGGRAIMRGPARHVFSGQLVE
jgi:diaminopimelate epimerase